MLNHFNALLPAKLQTQVLQLELLNLSASRHRKFLHEENIFRNLVAGNLSLTELTDIVFVHRISFVQDDEGSHRLAVFF